MVNFWRYWVFLRCKQNYEDKIKGERKEVTMKYCFKKLDKNRVTRRKKERKKEQINKPSIEKKEKE